MGLSPNDAVELKAHLADFPSTMVDDDEETALLWVGLPVLIAFLPFCVFILPKHLRKAGIL